MKIVLILMIFVMVSLWEYCMFFRNRGRLPYVAGFAIFSIIQWLIIYVASAHMWGWIYGLISLIICATVLQYITHFSIGLIWNVILKDDPAKPLALFTVMVWLTGVAVVISYLI